MPAVSITRLRVRAWRYLPAFLLGAYRSVRQARRVPGNIAATVLADRNFAFWTNTVWVDEAALRSFMLSGAHRLVMPRLLDWCDEASLVRWTQDTAERPSWSEAHRRMQAEGRRSKVRHPSAAQQRFEFPAPRASG